MPRSSWAPGTITPFTHVTTIPYCIKYQDTRDTMAYFQMSDNLADPSIATIFG
jgi:hypothetical protein